MKDYTEQLNQYFAVNSQIHGDLLTKMRFDNVQIEGFGVSVPADGLLWRHPDIGRVEVTSFSWMCDGCHASLESNICDYCGNEFLEDAWRQ